MVRDLEKRIGISTDVLQRAVPILMNTAAHIAPNRRDFMIVPSAWLYEILSPYAVLAILFMEATLIEARQN